MLGIAIVEDDRTTPRCWKRISANMPLSTTCRYRCGCFTMR